jgi:hypothetical protein
MDWVFILVFIIIIGLIVGTFYFYKLVYNFFVTLFTSKPKGSHEDYDIEDFNY